MVIGDYANDTSMNKIPQTKTHFLLKSRETISRTNVLSYVLYMILHSEACSKRCYPSHWGLILLIIHSKSWLTTYGA